MKLPGAFYSVVFSLSLPGSSGPQQWGQSKALSLAFLLYAFEEKKKALLWRSGFPSFHAFEAEITFLRHA